MNCLVHEAQNLVLKLNLRAKVLSELMEETGFEINCRSLTIAHSACMDDFWGLA